MDKLRKFVRNILDKILIFHGKRIEIKKFKTPERKEIWKNSILSYEQKKQIDELYIKNYGKKIPYVWHRHYTAFMNNFDPKFFPELLYIPEFEHYMNINFDYCKVFGDKNVLPMIAMYAGVKMPKTVLSCVDGILFTENVKELSINEACDCLAEKGELFGKPSVDSNSGKGCVLVDFHNGKDLKSNKSVKNILDSLGDNFVIQERIHCHEDIKKIYPDSVNTFRIITYRWKDMYHHMPVIMRIGRGGNYLDNAHAGGMFIGVENDGTLKNKAITEFKQEFFKHPDTGVFFENYKISGIDKVIEAALTMSRAMPQIGVVNWDFTIGEDGNPILIEANMNGGSVWLIEMAHGRGAFEDLTPEILKWLHKMEKLQVSQYKDHRFGR